MSNSQNSGGSKPISVKALPAKNPLNSGSPSNQYNLFVDKEKERDGVGMGVLCDGTAFLTGMVLGRLCGCGDHRVSELGPNWGDKVSTNGMVESVKKILRDAGVPLGDAPYVRVSHNGNVLHAYSA